jgi:hypothetical protein
MGGLPNRARLASVGSVGLRWSFWVVMVEQLPNNDPAIAEQLLRNCQEMVQK